ncbi:Hypothetical protein, putative [Bodo saltans]|uniref:Enkurin domain-containing protein n=1 Tax=Bodo saltans TaxID=75058 RepID=A0A0S4IVI3_BODSA|nr:Hypothetical protein, putative [Bodo saltans]|eukprot:CUG03413.1 Hypothetical protein, putative [Bodo saltans]
MSNLVHRYTPTEYVLLNSQREKDRRIDACAGLVSTPRAAAGGRLLQQQQPRPLSASGSQQHHSTERRRVTTGAPSRDAQKLNINLLREVEERNKLDRENKKLAYITTQMAEIALREQHSGHRHASTTEQLARSPRRNVVIRDMSDAAELDDQRRAAHSQQRLPDYLQARIKEQREQKDMEAQAIAVAESERAFPTGQEPLNPDVTERTREFLEMRVAELAKQLRDVSFRASCSLVGQRRKADIEQQLRDAESALARFNFPVVFVRTSKPRPVLNQLRK